MGTLLGGNLLGGNFSVQRLKVFNFYIKSNPRKKPGGKKAWWKNGIGQKLGGKKAWSVLEKMEKNACCLFLDLIHFRINGDIKLTNCGMYKLQGTNKK